MKFGSSICRSIVGVAATVLLAACSAPQILSTVQTQPLSLTRPNLNKFGIAFMTPSSVTGQEEDKQALALAFGEVLRSDRPDIRVVSLPATLSAVNRAGLSADYRRMLDDYRATGLLDRRILQQVGRVAGARYLAQLKLAGFRQESKERWGAFGLRIFQTKSTVVRLFLQIWDSDDGSIAWEGTVELTSSHDSTDEGTVTFHSAIVDSARRLIERLP
ncbi:MAG: hypothetical protein WCI19_08345 [Betaproteobacteria bacterium]|nr:hypothetical protein [Rhodocyclales bacterium]